MYKKYDIKLIDNIITEIENGNSKLSLSKKYNIPRGTINYWCKNKDKNISEKPIDILDLDSISYSYILGVYLGDGHINKMLRTYRLRFFLDSRQDLVIEECVKHLKILFPSNSVNVISTKYNYVIITLYSNNIPYIFPQHGKGEKYKRKIKLNDKQKKIIKYNQLMKGLFHSDGSYFIALSKYPRYQFTNKSKDLIDLFGKCLIKNNITPKIRKRKNGIYDIQIQNKKDVSIMYKLVGEKYKTK